MMIIAILKVITTIIVDYLFQNNFVFLAIFVSVSAISMFKKNKQVEIIFIYTFSPCIGEISILVLIQYFYPLCFCKLVLLKLLISFLILLFIPLTILYEQKFWLC